ncbi:histidine phosphatase family protein [Streptomyces bobili]|uniref:histidine phosphatase family protein n=1 Tax=Streptomyces bobili TaxID=67280 RepID=UPI00344229E9
MTSPHTAALTLYRHAPTDSNGSGVYMGSRDLPPTDAGLSAAAATAPQDWADHFTRFYCSPLQRAARTAEAMFPGASIEPDARLAERSLGRWEGMAHADVRERHPDAFLSSGHLDPRFTPPGGEDLTAFLTRITDFLAQMSRLEGREHIVAVSHNGWIRSALHLTGDFPMEEIFAAGVPFAVPVRIPLRHFAATSTHDPLGSRS